MYAAYRDRALEWRALQDQVDGGQLDTQSRLEYNRVCDAAARAHERVQAAAREYQAALDAYNRDQAAWVVDVTHAANVRRCLRERMGGGGGGALRRNHHQQKQEQQ